MLGALPVWLQAGVWGWIAGSALLIGALFGYFSETSRRVTAAVMAFGSGVLISALSMDLMQDAFKKGGFDSTAAGFLGGSIVYTAGNWYLAKRGAKHRKRSGKRQPSEGEHQGSGLALALGALVDGIPESVVIGTSIVGGASVSLVTVAAVFLSNIPEGHSSSAGMRQAGRPARYVFGVWGAICLVSGIAALFGYAIMRSVSPEWIAATTALAAGAILTMVVDTMVPEAFAEARNLSGLVAVAGFLAAFVLAQLSG
jgi:ZIP family zinc transporter